MSRSGSSVESRLLIWVLGLSLAVISAIILANVAALLLAVPGVIASLGALLGADFAGFAERVKSVYPLIHVSNIVICGLGTFIILMLRRILIVFYPKKMTSVETSLRVAAIAGALLLIELIGSVARFAVFGDKLTYLKVFNYAGIGCIVILAYILFHAARTSDKDGVI